ncbi:MAG TPA: hypothetical protein VKA30_09555 [Actinomycetota bacterium]|nr:hypothetical protein [Actinomycetota bacterium]
MAIVPAHRIRLVVLILVGIGLGLLLGRLVLPPGGPDPVLEPTPSAVSVSPTAASPTTPLP